MFEPVIHYLIEAVRICAHVTDLPTVVLAGCLVGIAAVLTAVLAMRARVGR